ncbi:TRAP transporter substrate-binding protein [Clostridium sp. Marseille-P2415]|uniref:TRAP transporter substrate-binding protein n=1 Tax=Clostridium sp. Marseille-P2415 TaxID=1805471 RepID=UPI0009883FE4|nr:DctP family TRAP transporter solute-binding subunit [Clostridium sp. Marseille-P2415]
MKRIVALLLGVSLTAGLLAGCGSSAGSPTAAGNSANSGSGYEKLDIKIASIGTKQGADTVTAQHFADLVNEASGGQIKVTVFSDGSLTGSSMAKMIEMLVSGGVFDIAITSGSTLGHIDERFLTHQIPFLFKDYDEATKYLDGTGGEYYTKLMAEKGLMPLGSFYNGMRQLTNSKKEVTGPEDLKNMKIRVPNGEVYMKTLKDLGADPIAMSWGEVFTALQQGTIDGEENGYQTIYSNNIHEVQPYITEWNWSFDCNFITVNQAAWNKYSEAAQTLLKEKAEEAAQWGREQMLNDDKKIKQEYLDGGKITITELTDEQRQVFVDAVRPVQEYFIDKFGAESCAAWGLE